MFSAEYEQDPSCGMSDCQYQHCPAYYEEHPYVYQYAQHYTLHVQTNERFSDSNKTLDQRLSSLESGLGSLRGEILQAFINLERKTVARSRSPSNSPVRDPPSSPTRNQCFGCGGQGHFIADCPSKRTENRPARKVHFEEKNLNSKGSGPVA